MKILMVVDALSGGGQERQLLEHIKGLLQYQGQYDIYLVSLTDTVEYKYVYDLPIQFDIVKRKYKKDVTVFFKLRNIIKRFRPDIIHSWSYMASVYLSFSNLFTGIPLVNGIIADAFADLNLSDKNYLRVKLVTPFTDIFISNSEAGIRAYHLHPDKAVVINNGIDFGRFENLNPIDEVEKEMIGGPKEGRIILGMIAGFDGRKDFGTLINAAIKICSERKDLVFLLIGGGPDWESLKSRVPDDLINKQIVLTGKRSDVESIIQIFDIGMLITFYEGISNAIIEYMALGKPVIATNGGGTSELVIDGVNGYLVERRNESQIIEKMKLLIDDGELRMKMGRNGSQWVRQQFDLNKKTNEYIRLYKKLLDGNGKSEI